MRLMIITSAFITFTLLLAACNSDRQTPAANTGPQVDNTAIAEAPTGQDDDYIMNDFDLQRVGDLLERSKTPQEFESYLNRPDGINNLDLNGDGYADYISVDEFGGPDDYERGLSLYTRYGPDRAQDLGTVYFYRDEPRYTGARVVLTGNDNLYGDNYYYEINWLDKTLDIVSLLFTPKRDYYRSPYYYDNYPTNYSTYNVVNTPIYRSRVVELYPRPVFVYTTGPEWFSKIKVKSPNNGLHLGQIFGRPKKPTIEQAEFIKNNPRGPKRGNFDDKGKDFDKKSGRSDDAPGKFKKEQADKRNDDDKGGRGKPEKVEKQDQGNPDKGGKGKGGNPNGGGKGKGKP